MFLLFCGLLPHILLFDKKQITDSLVPACRSWQGFLTLYWEVHLLFLTDFPGIPSSYTEFRKKTKKIRDMPENWIRGRKYGSEKLDGTMISGSQLFAAESSWFGKNTEFKNKKAGHFPNTETEVRPRTATTMQEKVRQDV